VSGPRAARLGRRRDARALRGRLRAADRHRLPGLSRRPQCRAGMNCEVESFQRFIGSTIQDLVQSLAGLDEAQLNWRPPAAETNSLYAIATHVLGNAEENVLRTLCGLSVQRSRPAEFAARASTWEPVRDRWLELRTRIESAMATLSSGDLD